MSKYNFSKVKVNDIDGKLIPSIKIHKGLANAVYTQANNLDLVETAMEINKGKVVELEAREITEIESILKNPNCSIVAFGRKALLDYIEGVKSGKAKTKRKN